MTPPARWNFLFILFAAVLAATALTTEAAPAAGNTIVWGKPGDITGFDVQINGTVTSWQMYEMIYDTLLTTNKNMQLEPELAKSWKQTSPTTYVFKLRKDAKFSNGRPVVAADVIGGLKRIENPETASYWAAQLGNIARMEALDKHTVKIVLAKPHPAFLSALAFINAAILPMKELKNGSFDPTKQFLGSGPFMVVGHKPDQSWTLKKNPYYWRKDYPLADKLKVLIIPDESARMAALRSGRIDFTTFTNPDSRRMLASEKNIKVATQQTTNYYRIDVNALSKKSPFHNQLVRRAMNLALNRKTINKLVFAGTSKVDYPVPRAFGTKACHDLPTYTLPHAKRIKKAKALLKKAGKEHPKVTLMATSANPILGRIAQVIQSSLQQAGFKVNITQPSLTEYLNKVFTKGDFDFALSWLAGFTDPTMVVSWWNPKFAVWDQSFMQDVPKLDKALESVKQMPKGAKREKKLNDICKMINKGANLIALVSRTSYFAYRTDKIGVKVAPRAGTGKLFQYVYEFKPLD